MKKLFSKWLGGKATFSLGFMGLFLMFFPLFSSEDFVKFKEHYSTSVENPSFHVDKQDYWHDTIVCNERVKDD